MGDEEGEEKEEEREGGWYLTFIWIPFSATRPPLPPTDVKGGGEGGRGGWEAVKVAVEATVKVAVGEATEKVVVKGKGGVTAKTHGGDCE